MKEFSAGAKCGGILLQRSHRRHLADDLKDVKKKFFCQVS